MQVALVVLVLALVVPVIVVDRQFPKMGFIPSSRQAEDQALQVDAGNLGSSLTKKPSKTASQSQVSTFFRSSTPVYEGSFISLSHKSLSFLRGHYYRMGHTPLARSDEPNPHSYSSVQN